MTTYKIISNMSCAVTSDVELPDGRTWDDVKEWYVKWGELVVTFKDGSTSVIEMLIDEEESVNWKRPILTEVYAVNNDGDWVDPPLAERDG